MYGMRIPHSILAVIPAIMTSVMEAAPQDTWKQEIPRPVHPNKELVELYDKTWEIAHGRIRDGGQGLPTSPYMDENCYDTDIWIWDTVLMALFSKYAPDHFPGITSLDNFYIPIHENIKIPLNIHLRDNPPIFAWAELNNLVFTGDRNRAHLILHEKQYLQKHFDWFNTVPQGTGQPCSNQKIYRGIVGNNGFTWTGGASGMDNTPRGRNSGGYGKIMWVDAISQQALSADCIAHMYRLENKTAEADAWTNRYEKLKELTNRLYWNEQDGFYYDVDIATGNHDKVKTIASYWPLMAGIASQEQAERMIQHLKDPNVFGGRYPLVSLARSDKDFNAATGDYWRGGIWLPTAYMVIKALERYGYNDLADDLAQRIVMQQLETFQNIAPHTIWECYSPSSPEPSTEHGRRVRPDFCGWSALGPISLFIENILGFRTVDGFKGEIHWTLKQANGEHGIRNLRFGGIVTDILYNGKNTVSIRSNKPYTLYINGKPHKITKGDREIPVRASTLP